MIGLDTNVLVRYIMQDDPKQQAEKEFELKLKKVRAFAFSFFIPIYGLHSHGFPVCDKIDISIRTVTATFFDTSVRIGLVSLFQATEKFFASGLRKFWLKWQLHMMELRNAQARTYRRMHVARCHFAARWCWH